MKLRQTEKRIDASNHLTTPPPSLQFCNQMKRFFRDQHGHREWERRSLAASVAIRPVISLFDRVSVQIAVITSTRH